MSERRAFVLQAIGTIPGRVSAPELCLAEVEDEVLKILKSRDSLSAAPFDSISVVVHLGTAAFQPRIGRVVAGYSELEVSVGVRFTDVRRWPRPEVCAVIRRAALDAVIATCAKYGLSSRPFIDASQGSAN